MSVLRNAVKNADFVLRRVLGSYLLLDTVSLFGFDFCREVSLKAHNENFKNEVDCFTIDLLHGWRQTLA